MVLQNRICAAQVAISGVVFVVRCSVLRTITMTLENQGVPRPYTRYRDAEHLDRGLNLLHNASDRDGLHSCRG